MHGGKPDTVQQIVSFSTTGKRCIDQGTPHVLGHCDVRETRSFGRSTWMCAVRFRGDNHKPMSLPKGLSFDAALALLKYSSDVNAMTGYERSVLDAAIYQGTRRGAAKVIDLLLQWGADEQGGLVSSLFDEVKTHTPVTA